MYIFIGHCVCQQGYTGPRCDRPCPKGFYGVGCKQACLPCTSGNYNFTVQNINEIKYYYGNNIINKHKLAIIILIELIYIEIRGEKKN